MFNHNFKNNLIKLNFPNEVEGIDESNTIGLDPMFVNPGFGKNDLRLKSETEAVGIASPTFAEIVQLYILNLSRTNCYIVGDYKEVYVRKKNIKYKSVT